MKGGRYLTSRACLLIGTALFAAGCSASVHVQDTMELRREPAPVMGWQGAAWLERSERESLERPEALLDLFGLQPGDDVADLGCGTGYFARRMARRVAPEGRVYCADIQPEMLELMRELAPEKTYPNVVPILSAEDDPNLPEGEIDFVLLVDVYHEIREPEEVLARLREALAPGGRIGLVEYRLEGRSATHIRREHRMSVDQVLAEWLPAGYELVERFDSMPSQHVFVFRPASEATE